MNTVTREFKRLKRIVALSSPLTLSCIILLSCGSGETRPHPTPTAGRPVLTPIGAVVTQISGGAPFSDPDAGEQLVGFPLLRVDGSRFRVLSQKGLTETFPEIGLPRARQVIVVPGHERTLDFTQQPAAYPTGEFPGGDVSEVTFGPFTGELSTWRDQICFEFDTGANLEDSAIRALICSSGGYSIEEIELFVLALSFGTASTFE